MRFLHPVQDRLPGGLQSGEQLGRNVGEGLVRVAVVHLFHLERGILQQQPGHLGAGHGQGGLGEVAVLLDESGIGGAVVAQMGLPPLLLNGA